MNIENAVRALTDLSAVDEKLADADFPEERRRVELRDRRTALRGAIPEIVLTTYDALARSHRRPVVVAVASAHCGGCHLRLPPQLDSAVRRRQSLSVCPHCRRLLYPAPPPAASESAGVPARDVAPRPEASVSAGKRGPRARSARTPAKVVPSTRKRMIGRAAAPRTRARANGSRLTLELELQSR